MLVPLVSLPLIGMPGMWEWVLIILVILVIFGGSQLPKLGKGLGQGMRNFKEGLKGEGKDEPDEDTAKDAKNDPK